MPYLSNLFYMSFLTWFILWLNRIWVFPFLSLASSCQWVNKSSTTCQAPLPTEKPRKRSHDYFHPLKSSSSSRWNLTKFLLKSYFTIEHKQHSERHAASVRWVGVQSLSHVQLCNPMDCNAQGLPVHHHLLEFLSIESVMPSSHLILVTLFSFCLQSFPASGSFT